VKRVVLTPCREPVIEAAETTPQIPLLENCVLSPKPARPSICHIRRLFYESHRPACVFHNPLERPSRRGNAIKRRTIFDDTGRLGGISRIASDWQWIVVEQVECLGQLSNDSVPEGARIGGRIGLWHH
jgi:hypothetical protein